MAQVVIDALRPVNPHLPQCARQRALVWLPRHVRSLRIIHPTGGQWFQRRQRVNVNFPTTEQIDLTQPFIIHSNDEFICIFGLHSSDSGTLIKGAHIRNTGVSRFLTNRARFPDYPILPFRNGSEKRTTTTTTQNTTDLDVDVKRLGMFCMALIFPATS